MKLIESSKVLKIEFEFTELHLFHGNLALAMKLLETLHKKAPETTNAMIYINNIKPFLNQFERIILDNEYD